LKRTDAFFEELLAAAGIERHPLCRLTYCDQTGDYDCGYLTTLTCEECKYGMGTRNPEAKCNQL